MVITLTEYQYLIKMEPSDIMKDEWCYERGMKGVIILNNSLVLTILLFTGFLVLLYIFTKPCPDNCTI